MKGERACGILPRSCCFTGALRGRFLPPLISTSRLPFSDFDSAPGDLCLPVQGEDEDRFDSLAERLAERGDAGQFLHLPRRPRLRACQRVSGTGSAGIFLPLHHPLAAVRLPFSPPGFRARGALDAAGFARAGRRVPGLDGVRASPFPDPVPVQLRAVLLFQPGAGGHRAAGSIRPRIRPRLLRFPGVDLGDLAAEDLLSFCTQ